ncbi:helix-turn-helix domain-containing protein [Vibrio vulnificus]|nr:helix-turn-helix domain-containing protein [Vibrio vulnificus]MCU8355053.1 helix-turn-helix domain-containing protein [Vibrio vulnificus]MCU8494446.1 helix-turn-helix domain-containing protein [Vibrio vulnificus]MCU8559762.1 helix-turn-helix domain-containing protein [Vibrio vulnificus]
MYQRLNERKKLLGNGVPKAKAAKALGIGRATLYRLLDA